MHEGPTETALASWAPSINIIIIIIIIIIIKRPHGKTTEGVVSYERFRISLIIHKEKTKEINANEYVYI